MVAEDVHGASQLLGAHLGPSASSQLAQAFLGSCIHTNGLSVQEFGLLEPVELVVNVRLGPRERVLYRQAWHERAASLSQGDLQAYEDMLQLCSHFTLRRQETLSAILARMCILKTCNSRL